MPGFQQGAEGNCIYRSKPAIQRAFQFDRYKRADGTLNVNEQTLGRMSAELGGLERLLLKRMRYEEQCEYRFLWAVDAANGEYIDVQCPRAVEWCRRVLPSEFE